ncbi:glycoside hydrolase family 3 C-terminal domain-containing protein [Paenibacillus sp. VCA1]|uniref:beta-glucosidase n=1 Tax=Paenibacillus sp. VCA1 TaxID=3039148 RepID=UPI002871A793|nr:glycoside hydrolase family 3 C-terminal domain-containing protein [Paenibacillus sp. VCA1]MDR9853473.1 glycoside hydrolase family 3 C-terminal domain-containing protein [Paenibacillus sp. VCA1]
MSNVVNDLLSSLTLEEKASLVAGADMWKTRDIPRAGIPSIAMFDGTNGVRKPASTNEMGLFTENIPATSFPTGVALGSSWNAELLYEVGAALGRESLALDTQILLGPGVNMKRSPLGGRNFEYYSEDPVLSGELGAAMVKGLQSMGVGASVKHFACNNQETEKMISNSVVDERTLREIYLTAFEIIVKKADPWTVMCSYNQLNGTYTSEHEHLLKDILRDEWHYDGVVMSDWTAVYDRLKALRAGLDLEMPGPASYNAAKLAAAVRSGELEEETLNASVRRILTLVEKTTAAAKSAEGTWDVEAHHALARKAAAESIVLLKNENGTLPIGMNETKSIAVIGQKAKKPRFQGGGSARVTPTKLDIPYDEMEIITNGKTSLSFAEGYRNDNVPDEALIEESVRIAKSSDLAVIFAGQPEGTESEGYDSNAIDLPPAQVELIKAVSAVQPRCVVVLCNGTALAMKEWIDRVPAVVELWLSGQGSGAAIAGVLFGHVNPSGKLSETFPVKLSDNPSYLTFGDGNHQAVYSEGIFTGYRYYDKKELDPLFPFGHGLSYTTFEYRDLKVTIQGDKAAVECQVHNTGSMEGKEVVQLYVHDEASRLIRPVKELKGFAKIPLQPGETKTVTFALEPRDFSYFDPKQNRWVAETGAFTIMVGSSSRDIRLSSRMNLTFEPGPAPELGLYSLIADWMAAPNSREALLLFIEEMNRHITDKIALDDQSMAFLGDFPLVKLIQLYGQEMLQDRSPESVVQELIKQVNGKQA